MMGIGRSMALFRGPWCTRSVAKIICMTNAKPKRKAKVIDITERRRETTDVAKFIDAHGGRLGAFRGYQVRPPASPPSEQRSPGREE
jgi:hypothetical protein